MVDPDVHEKLKSENVNPQFYSLRWLMLLCCQEFDMPNVIRLWDTLFSDPLRYDFLNYICCAIVEECREEILDGDFATCMETLQAKGKQIMDVSPLIERACDLEKIYHYKKKKEEEKKEK